MVDASIGWLVDWLIDVQFDWLVAWLIVLPPKMFQTKNHPLKQAIQVLMANQPLVSLKVGLMKPSFPKGVEYGVFLVVLANAIRSKCDSKVQRAIKMLSSKFWFQQWGHESSNANPASSARSRFRDETWWWKIWENQNVEEVWEFSLSIENDASIMACLETIWSSAVLIYLTIAVKCHNQYVWCLSIQLAIDPFIHLSVASA